mgnify:CR=1 FL=1
MRSVLQPPTILPLANDPCWCGSARKYKRCHKLSEGRVLPGEISPMRSVPDHIARPSYADTGNPVSWDEPRIKTPEIIERMRYAGQVAAEILRLTGEFLRPGITTEEVDEYCHFLYIERNSYPSTLNYHHYPQSLCTSANEVICHGIPDSRAMLDGDIMNLDVTAFIGGVHGDTNATFCIGDVDPQSRELVRITEQCTWKGIEAVKPGRPISDVGRAIEEHAKAHRLGVVSNPAPPPTDVVLKMTSLQIVDAQTSSGDVTSLGADDDSNELLLASRRQGKNEVTAFEASGSATVGVVTKLDISFEPHQTTSGVSQKLLLWNVQSAAWESVWSTSAPTTATAPLTVTVSGDPNRFVSPAGQVRARVESRAKGSSHQMGVDVLWFTLKQS